MLQQSGSSPGSSTETASAVEYLIRHYARKYSWEICFKAKGVPHVVQCAHCADVKTLILLSNLFYGMRNIFCHGSPQKTICGALRVDRIPQELSDINIINVQSNQDKKKLCKEYLLEQCKKYLLKVAKDVKKNASGMKMMDHNLFLTTQSFYAYVAEITGSVAECIAYKYSHVMLKTKAEKADKSKMEEIKTVSLLSGCL